MAYVTSGLQVYLDAKDYPSNSTSTIWADKSGNGNDFTLNGFNYTSSSGWTGVSLKSDSVDDYAILTKTGVITNSGFTIELYVKMPYADNWNLLFANSYSYDNKYGVYMSQNYMFSTGNGAWNGDLQMPSNDGSNFVHVVMVWNGTTKTKTYYINNVAGTPFTVTDPLNYMSATPTIKTTLFANTDANAKVAAEIGLLRMYNRVLSAAEISQNFNSLNPAIALTGAIGSTSSVNATLKVSKPLSGSTTSASTVSATLTNFAGRALTGSIGAKASVSGDLLKVVSLNGSMSASTLVSGTIAKAVNLTGAVSLTSVLTASLSNIVIINASGSVDAVSSVTGSIRVLKPLSGSVTSNTTAVAFLNLPRVIYAEVNMSMGSNFDINSSISNSFDINGILNNTYDLNMAMTREVTT